MSIADTVFRVNCFERRCREGNKRTGFAAGAALIHLVTGKKVLASANEVVRVSIAVEEKSLDLAALSEWFEAHTRAP